MLGLDIATILSRVIVLVVAFTVHELAHAWTADFFGDDTPRLNGRLSFNPLVHLDPLGSLLLLVAGFGWARPVPVNMYALQRENEYAPMWVALAGPVSNLVLALVAAIPFQLGLVQLQFINDAGQLLPSLNFFMTEFMVLNLILQFFNLVPISPLDGEKVLTYLLPAQSRGVLNQIRPYGPMLMLALIFVLPQGGLDVLDLLIWTPARLVLSFLVG